MKTPFLAFALLTVLGASPQAAAVGRWVDLGVYDRTSEQELPVYRYQGRYYVAGQPGHRYEIHLRNIEGERILSVISVDGVNAISGDTADWSQTGYVLGAYTSTDIRGWRKSLEQVADFVFADAAQSYATRTGRPDNVGVIGVAVFRARPFPHPILPMRPEAASGARQAAESVGTSPLPPSAPASVAAIAPRVPVLDASGPLGTGHGPREDSSVSYTDFKRASTTPDEVITLYYDTREHLLAQGVIPSPGLPQPGLPTPFPGHFVPDPQ
ncbi:hypothetical protein ISN76_01380 [Dyella halodurans]|uniref:Uncharacterized protein n=1 Tax=Dyella halodurans TaxID=1920171 RepID=A0ABV9BZF6_9GAMM|nr:hypothetical protein [Dyella halodurans]